MIIWSFSFEIAHGTDPFKVATLTFFLLWRIEALCFKKQLLCLSGKLCGGTQVSEADFTHPLQLNSVQYQPEAEEDTSTELYMLVRSAGSFEWKCFCHVSRWNISQSSSSGCISLDTNTCSTGFLHSFCSCNLITRHYL